MKSARRRIYSLILLDYNFKKDIWEINQKHFIKINYYNFKILKIHNDYLRRAVYD